MDMKEIKTKIENNTLHDDPIVFKYVDNKFLVNQYINAICKNRNKVKTYIKSITEIPQEDVFGGVDDSLYIIDVDELKENITAEDKNVIVVCKKVSDDLSIDFTDVTKVENWQIEAFVQMRLKGLTDKEVAWLCSVCNYDIYRLDQECKKLETFTTATQELMFKQINSDNGYYDLNSLTIFNLSNALLKKDIKGIKAVLQDLETIDVEGTGLVTIMLKQFKRIIDIQLNPKATPESLNMNYKQFNAIKYSCNVYTNMQLVNIYDFLTNVDSRIKSGNLTFSENKGHLDDNNKLVDYVVTNILNFGSH